LGFAEFFNKLREARGLMGKPDPEKASFSEAVAESLGGVANSKVADVGCGSADIGYFLNRLGAHYIGIDPRRVEKADDSINVEYADARTIANRPGWASEFDICLLVDVVGYDRKLDRELLAACRKLIRDPGRLYLDWPREPEDAAGAWTDKNPDFSFRLRWRYDRSTRMQRVWPRLYYQDLFYTIRDDDAAAYPLSRYLYPVQEMTELLTSTGFLCIDAPHSEDPSYMRLIAQTA
jgi:SAM-dependent methyltransferase